jgi:hypothetical protein
MADLASFLRQYHSGQGTMTPEMYAHFGGDDILAQLKKFDPNAGVTDTSIGGGEGGDGQMGKRLDFDISKLPSSKSGLDVLDMRTTSGAKEKDGYTFLRNKDAVFQDENYGEITHAKNIGKNSDFLDKYGPMIGPLLVSMVAPMAAPAMFGAMSGGVLGAGALGAGFTSGVTGGAAGLGAGSIPGAMGAGTFSASNAPSWLKQLGKPSSLKGLGGQIQKGKFNPMAAAGTAASASGISLSQLAGLFR